MRSCLRDNKVNKGNRRLHKSSLPSSSRPWGPSSTSKPPFKRGREPVGVHQLAGCARSVAVLAAYGTWLLIDSQNGRAAGQQPVASGRSWPSRAGERSKVIAAKKSSETWSRPRLGAPDDRPLMAGSGYSRPRQIAVITRTVDPRPIGLDARPP